MRRTRKLNFSDALLQIGLASMLSWSRGRETTAGVLTNQLSRTSNPFSYSIKNGDEMRQNLPERKENYGF